MPQAMAQDVMIDIYVASTCHLHSRCLLCPSVCRHFTIRGADDTEFAGGIYHGRILLPPEYPFKPPNIVFLTPSGRFEVGTKVCLSFSAHHPELWQPAWGIRLILEALISFLPTPADGAIGALDWTKEERKRLAAESVKFYCAKCGPCMALLPKLKEGSTSSAKKPSRFQKEIEQLHAMQMSHHEKKDDGAENEKAETDGAETSASASAAGETSTTSNSGAEQTKDIAAEIPEIVSEEESQKPPATQASAESSATSGAENAVPSDEPSVPNISDTATAADEAQVIEGVNAQDTTTESVVELASTPTPAPTRQEERTAVPSEPPLTPWFSDPVVHAIIILFAILVAVLYRKFTILLDELQSLTND